MLEFLNQMNRYSRWMNGKLLAECSKLTDAQRKADRSAPFRSIHGIWNHLLLADRLWLSRFGLEPFTSTSLDQEIHADWDDFRASRAQTDDMVDRWLQTMTPEVLTGDLSFTRLAGGGEFTFSYQKCAIHFFNHGTHHRGQITALLEQAGGDCGVTDLLVCP